MRSESIGIGIGVEVSYQLEFKVAGVPTLMLHEDAFSYSTRGAT